MTSSTLPTTHATPVVVPGAKAALWLFAWSMRDRRAQQRETRGLLAYLSTAPRDLARTGS